MHPTAFLDPGAFPTANHHFRSEYSAGLIAAAARFYTRSALGSLPWARFAAADDDRTIPIADGV